MITKNGRPSKYDPDVHPKLARELKGEGKTMADIAKVFEVNVDTLNEWQKAHEEFAVAIRQGREDAVDKIERALHERAAGYRHKSEKIVVVGNEVVRVPIEVQYPPDTAAARLLLTNLRAGNWKDKQSVEHSGTLTLEQLVGESLKRDKPTEPPSAQTRG